MTTANKRLGDKIKKSRREQGFSQKALAKELGISDKTISSYEVGRATPSFPMIKKISGLLHKPIGYFDENADISEIDIQLKVKSIEKELAELKKLIGKRPKK